MDHPTTQLEEKAVVGVVEAHGSARRARAAPQRRRRSLASRTITAAPSDDFSFVFAVLTAVIIGGTSIAGGEGAVWRTLLGARAPDR